MSPVSVFDIAHCSEISGLIAEKENQMDIAMSSAMLTNVSTTYGRLSRLALPVWPDKFDHHKIG